MTQRFLPSKILACNDVLTIQSSRHHKINNCREHSKRVFGTAKDLAEVLLSQTRVRKSSLYDKNKCQSFQHPSPHIERASLPRTDHIAGFFLRVS